jgi:hypothetical protein
LPFYKAKGRQIIRVFFNLYMTFLLKLFHSERFWLAVLVAVLQILVILKYIDGVQAEAIVQVVQALIVVVIGIRTADRNGDKKVEAAIISTGSSPAEAKAVVQGEQ